MKSLSAAKKNDRRMMVNLFSRFTPAQMTCSTLMPLSYGVQERIEATFERSAVVHTETSWSKAGNSSALFVYEKEEQTALTLPEENHYDSSLTYSLKRILDGKPGMTDVEQALPALKLALELAGNTT